MKIVFVILGLAIGARIPAQEEPISRTLATEFVPAGYVVVDEIRGDLNNDKQLDHILVIKGTDNANFIIDDTGMFVLEKRDETVIHYRSNSMKNTAKYYRLSRRSLNAK